MFVKFKPISLFSMNLLRLNRLWCIISSLKLNIVKLNSFSKKKKKKQSIKSNKTYVLLEISINTNILIILGFL